MEMNRAIREDPGIGIFLLSGFEVRADGRRLHLPATASRLVAYLALQNRPVSRPVAAGVLWPESSQERAQASLRSALWRTRKLDERIIDPTHEALCLERGVRVDVISILAAVSEMDASRRPPNPLVLPLTQCALELLPDWYDDWVSFERESFRLRILHALEKMADLHRTEGSVGLAVDCAFAAVRLEPLRESAHRQLIAAHIAAGNASEAVNQFRYFRQLLMTELGVEPSELMHEQIESLGLGVGR